MVSRFTYNTMIFSTILCFAVFLPIGSYGLYDEDDFDQNSMFSGNIPNGIILSIAILLVSTLLVGAFMFYFLFIKEDHDEEGDEFFDQMPATANPIDFWSQEGASVQQQKQPTVQQFEAETSVDFDSSRSSSHSAQSDRDGKISSN